jgi:hypothetical protein
MIPTDPSMRAKFGFRARWRLTRRWRVLLPLRRQLFHWRLRIWNAARIVTSLMPYEGDDQLPAELEGGSVGVGRWRTVTQNAPLTQPTAALTPAEPPLTPTIPTANGLAFPAQHAAGIGSNGFPAPSHQRLFER